LCNDGFDAGALSPSQVKNSWLRWSRPAAPHRGDKDFSHEVYAAMQGCLACKACATQCPIKVDVPVFRSEFFELYHTRYRRPLRDYLIGGVERSARWMAAFPGLTNFALKRRFIQSII